MAYEETEPARALTPRQLEIVALYGAGLSYKMIAAKLGISRNTVKNHLAAVLERLHAENACHAVTLCWRQGLLK